MSDKSWKAFERRVAHVLGGKRVPVTGRQRGDAPDVVHDWLSIEAKYRKELPEWIKDAMRQAQASADEIQLPIVVIGEKGRNILKSWVICELGDFRDWFGDER